MLFNEMKYVYAVCKHRSFSKAAIALDIAQPTLSLMIKKAENRLGGPLFDRSKTPLVLTDLGRAYMQAATGMLRIEDEFQQFLSANEQIPSGVLSIGGTVLLTSYVLPPLLAAFSARYPGVKIYLHEHSTQRLDRELQEEYIDLAMDSSPLNSTLFESAFFQTEEIILAVPRKIAESPALRLYRMTTSYLQRGGIQGAAAVPLKLLSEYSFITSHEGTDIRMRTDKLCHEAGFAPNVLMQTDHQMTAYNLAAAGLGIAFISSTLVNHISHDNRLMFFRLSGENARRDIRFYYRRNQPASSPAAAFVQMFQNYQPLSED